MHIATSKVHRLQATMAAMPQVDLQTTHALSGGVYARTVFIPAGCVVVGATHKQDHVCIIDGDIETILEGEQRRITGRVVINGTKGVKRAVVAHEDTLWTTVCATELTDLDAIEAALVEEPELLQTRLMIEGGRACLLG
jgi:quercetin dioxygenase-like cupin family protein